MLVVEIARPGGPEVLVPARRPVPLPGPDEIVIAVAAAGVNRPDLLQREGRYPPPPGATDIPGLEVAGTVASAAVALGVSSREPRSARSRRAAGTPNHLDLLAPEGRLILIAFLEGREAAVDLWPIMGKRLTVTGSTLRPRTPAEKGAIARALEAEVWPLIEAGRVVPRIDATFPLAAAADAHRRMEARRHVGKIVLLVEA